MSTNRLDATATRLQDGRVLIAGGAIPDEPTATAELYDPTTGTFSLTGSMTGPRRGHRATLLHDGKVLVTGGAADNTAEIFDPASGKFSKTGLMADSPDDQTATLLEDGKVLVAGGYLGGDKYTTAVQVYDPGTGTFTATGSMKVARANATATLLPDGRVLIAGGEIASFGYQRADILASTEIYDPTSGEFSLTAPMSNARSRFAASFVHGRVLVAGGIHFDNDQGLVELATAELFDPVTGQWSPAGSMDAIDSNLTITILDSGSALVVGGGNPPDVYDPVTDKFTLTGDIALPRGRHTTTLLADGRVLVAGGNPNPMAEVYWP
jgi:large repetitive protein